MLRISRTAIFFLFFLNLLSVGVRAEDPTQYSSWTETHGGDPIAFEFNLILKEINSDILNLDRHDFLPEGFAQDFMEKSIRNIRQVISTSAPLIVRGDKKDAINRISPDPTKKDIIINIDRWHVLTRDQKYFLILHEALLVAGYDDRDYTISDLLFALNKLLHKIYETYPQSKEKSLSEYVKKYEVVYKIAFPKLRDVK